MTQVIRRLTNEWPKIHAFAEKNGHEIVFGDESHFAVSGHPGYTWCPAPQRATITMNTDRKGCSVIGGLSYFSNEIHGKIILGKVDSSVFIDFCKDLIKKHDTHIHFILDNASIHHSKEVWKFIKQNSDKITIHFIPPYSPECNPIEKLWLRMKHHYLANRMFDDVNHLTNEICNTFQVFQDNPVLVDRIFDLCPDIRMAA